jgi:hypothetical protein
MARGLEPGTFVVSALLGSIAITLASCAHLSSSTPGTTAPSEQLSFTRDIRPIISDKCFACHGPDEEARKRDLRLDLREGLFGETRDGFDLIVPGDPEDSEFFLRLAHEDPDELMPPPASKMTLTEDEIAKIHAWIEQGAEYESHWAFNAPKSHPAPSVRNEKWGRSTIDDFILARVEGAGLRPSPDADKRTLIRRLSFDLTGLPPSREEVQAFLADDSETAYERLVDRLLASPHYGERMALAWMDQSRYADTNGFSIDGGRHMWLWRDWVIQAYNDDMPFDQFLREQVAGDLLENATDQQIVASGFNRNHMITHEGGTIPEENLNNYCVDRVKTTAEVFLGLTMACAQCHDHKYDPITQRDYYRLYAYFNTLSDRGLDGNAGRNASPQFTATTAIPHRDVDVIAARVTELEGALAQAMPERQAQWEEDQRRALAARGQDLDLYPLLPLSAKSPNLNPTLIKIQDDGTVFATRHFPQAYTVSAQLLDADIPPVTGLRIEFYPHPDVQDGSIGYGKDDREGAFGLNAIAISSGQIASDELDQNHLVSLADATASYQHPDWAARHVLDPIVSNAWSPLGQVKTQQHLTLTFANPVDPADTPYFTTMLCGVNRDTGFSTPGHFALFAVTGNDDGTNTPEDVQAILHTPHEQRTPEQRDRIRAYHAAHNPDLSHLRDELEVYRKRHDEMILPFSTLVMDTAETPRPTHILGRGSYDQPGETVEPGTPAFLPPLPEDAPANRQALADWFVGSDHPLTSRVAVNRIWQNLFGTGLVATSADFGSQGEPPSHPELLDTLAVDFVESGWGVKALTKQIVMSSTYRQRSHVKAESLEVDPDNRLLSYGPRFRLPGEMIRDNALKVSGLLVPWVGGSSVKPYQPAGLWREISHYGSSPATAQVFKQDSSLDLWRRSLYTYWKRTLPPPSMMAFDAPNRELCTMRRESTNTPLQALVLMNDPQFLEASRAFAERILLELPEASDKERIAFAFEVVTGRVPTRSELNALSRELREQRAVYELQPGAAEELLSTGAAPRDETIDAADYAAYTMVANLILNLSETVTRG